MSAEGRHRDTRMSPPGYWALVRAGEPFRLFFPLGTLFAILGVALWPLYVWGFTASYPGQMHARIMIEGFLACFVMGFLGTALPRLLETPGVTLYETLVCAALLTAAGVMHLAGRPVAGDLLFLLGVLLFVAVLGVRFMMRRDTPPPGFVLVGLGLVCALTGTVLFLIPEIAPARAAAWQPGMARLLLYQGFLLLPVMGVGPFLLPRFFQVPSRHAFPESYFVPRGWWPRALTALGCGVAVLAGCALEADGSVRAGAVLRAVAVGGYFAAEMPFRGRAHDGGTLAFGVRTALFCIPAGYVLAAVFPGWSVSWLHVVFISGLGLLTLLVAARVVYGHGGQLELLRGPLRWMRVVIGLVGLAMLTRVGADGMPGVRMSHYAYAAVVWMAAVGVWAVFVLRFVGRAEGNDRA
jgi:Uncharacterized protein involved in response to NO